MRLEDWEPIYSAILNDFGFSREKDEAAALLLSGLLKDRRNNEVLKEAQELVMGKNVVICGNAPCLANELRAMNENNAEYIAADGAVATLLEEDILPGLIVTDLDGPIQAIREANKLGSIVVVHAHGDNLEALKKYVPLLSNVIGTTQSNPIENVYNFWGFTDGDRCVFLARHFEARKIELIGFDFDDAGVTPRKKKKLIWARRLIELAMSENPVASYHF
jgi:2-amino-4-hydroxy-6-hydroxymethyldihydropteridine diphosphokinase